MFLTNWTYGQNNPTNGEKRSLKWIQEAVNDKPRLLDKPVKNFIGAAKKQKIEWVSPNKDDDYAEYRDQAFLELLRIKLTKTKLNDFWPARRYASVSWHLAKK